MRSSRPRVKAIEDNAWAGVAPSILRDKTVFALREDGLGNDAREWLQMRLALQTHVTG